MWFDRNIGQIQIDNQRILTTLRYIRLPDDLDGDVIGMRLSCYGRKQDCDQDTGNITIIVRTKSHPSNHTMSYQAVTSSRKQAQ